MAYIDQRTGGNQKLATMTVVALIQGAVAVALINGLAVKWMKPDVIPNPKATDAPITVPIDPPPPPKDPVTKPDDHLDVVKPPIDLPPVGGGAVAYDSLQPQRPFEIIQTYVEPLPPVKPTLSFKPHPAKPRNAPGSWATTNDYPARDLREGNQGIVGFLLTIGADGKVLSCAVTRPSSHEGLDKATCDNVSRRARFDPATDENGDPVQGTYSSSIRWQIPQD